MAIRIVPETTWGDAIIAFKKFVVRHRRFPSRHKMWINDCVYRLKTSDEVMDPLRVFVSDKEFVKHYVTAKVGGQHNIPTLHVLHHPDEVAGFDFPDECCIKPTHASGAVIIRRDGEPIDREIIAKWFDLNFYTRGRERNYKYLKPKVIIEPLIFGATDPVDYKYFCYNGVPKLMQVDFDRSANHARVICDCDWMPQDFSIRYPVSTKAYPKPQNLDQMTSIAAALSRDFTGLIRVDLYSDGNQVLVGELTNTPGNAGSIFFPRSSEATASKIIFGE
jgi:hypothetical protein